MKGFWARWVAFWDEREAPTSIVLVRVLVAAVMLADMLSIGAHGIAGWLWPFASGRLVSSDSSSWLFWGALTLTIFMFGIGAFTRTSAFAFVLLSAQAAMMNPVADRGIDRAVRIVVLILACSAAGSAWSVDAKRRTGRFRGDGGTVSSWPRHLIVCQLVLLYCAAGLSKGGTRWYPWGGYTALFVALRDPIFSSANYTWLSDPIPYFLTRVATASTHLWELGSPLLLVAAFYRRTADRSGRVRRLFNRLPVRNAYVAIGVVFHLSLALTLRLGIFPFAMLAFYPAFFRPDEWARVPWRSLVARLMRPGARRA